MNGDGANNSATGSGAAYVFARSGTTWSQQAYLKASNTETMDRLGQAVSLSGDTLVITAPPESSKATGVNGNQADNSAYASGAAYVFTRSGTTWSQQAYLKASNTEAYDQFSSAVSLSGDTLVVGARSESSNATGVNGDQANNLAPGSGAAYVFTLKIPPSPFLDLPFQYTNFSVAANGNFSGSSGRVNSWFDHSIPNYSKNSNLTKWDGSLFDFTQVASIQGLSWYDGHNGTDFSHDRSQTTEDIYAAANGTVFGVVNNCGGCTTSYGNRVWIDHNNGYATLYGHLNTVSVTNGTLITDRIAQPLGVMGNTGGSKGVHLHFGLYYDQNGDGQWTESEVVDPYGWKGATNDSWSVPSLYLWIHPLSAQQLIEAWT